ncbi:MAG: 4Fe-4S dicluster domain-containing protein [Deltaproteobacteria bacterium]|nr:4Fe-4S dicluster domain-containing protein [Deltaproteobacteria bacterium]
MKSLVADPAKCTGAMKCVPACSQQIFKRSEEEFSSIRVKNAEGKWEFTICDQCGDCIPICPTKALQRNKAGIVVVKKDLCVGCFMCIGFCPKGAMFRAPKATEPFKCLSCNACVKACPTGALKLEERDHSKLPA